MAAASERPVALPAVVDLDTLEDVRDALLAESERGAILVSGDAVERISTNALLLLASAAETARRNNFSFEIAAASPAMRAAIDRLGLTSAFSAMLRG
jgi:anti-anti-sigma regulatory factor